MVSCMALACRQIRGEGRGAACPAEKLQTQRHTGGELSIAAAVVPLPAACPYVTLLLHPLAADGRDRRLVPVLVRLPCH